MATHTVTVPVSETTRARLERIRDEGVPLARVIGAGLEARIQLWETRLGLPATPEKADAEEPDAAG